MTSVPSDNTIPLHKASKGSHVVIIDIPDGKSKDQLIRLGILKGELVKCLETLPGGTMVIEKNRQEIAIGVSLAKIILVAYATTNPPIL